MITGQNSEIRHIDVVFHIQTEDKGVSNPFIVSLIYVGGQVLAAKRTSYGDELAAGLGETELAELMERQHRTMIAAIRHGRFDEQVGKFLAKRRSTGKGLPAAEPTIEAPVELAKGNAPADSLVDMVGSFLGAEVPESLALDISAGESPRLGEHFELRLRTVASPTERPVSRASVRVELISPMREPELLAETLTDEEGWLSIAFLIPPVDSAMAALVVSATGEVGEAEETLLL
ncbi:MAG: hypothetical protein VYE73_09725 [Acidobacteriota bacterium]|nr:hypothetical protein [Acidobacteriota bacterium]